MPQQLVLIEPEPQAPRGPAGDRIAGVDDWHLDAETREIGLQGIAEAKRILTEVAGRVGERSAA